MFVRVSAVVLATIFVLANPHIATANSANFESDSRESQKVLVNGGVPDKIAKFIVKTSLMSPIGIDIGSSDSVDFFNRLNGGSGGLIVNNNYNRINKRVAKYSVRNDLAEVRTARYQNYAGILKRGEAANRFYLGVRAC